MVTNRCAARSGLDFLAIQIAAFRSGQIAGFPDLSPGWTSLKSAILNKQASTNFQKFNPESRIRDPE